MAEIIAATELVSYLPGLDLAAADPAVVLYTSLANGLVSDVLKDVPLDPVPIGVKAVTLEVAARGLRGADGYTSVTKSSDQTSKTWRRETPDGKAGVYLSDDERADLWSAVGRKSQRRRVGTIRIGLLR